MLVTVVEYNPLWGELFNEEAEQLKFILGDIANHIYHIGSTAVPGLMAKPIIDIMLDVISLKHLDVKNEAFEKLGYEVKGEFGIPGRRYFRKGGDHRTHQIHAFKSGDSNLIRHLVFRDYLIAHKKTANEYGKLKFDIAKKCNNDIEKYCDEKDSFVKHHEAKALEWYKGLKL